MVFKGKARAVRTKLSHRKNRGLQKKQSVTSITNPPRVSDVDDALEGLLLLQNVPILTPQPVQPTNINGNEPSTSDVEIFIPQTPIKCWPVSPRGDSPWKLASNEHADVCSTPRPAVNDTPREASTPVRMSPRQSSTSTPVHITPRLCTTPGHETPRQAGTPVRSTPRLSVTPVHHTPRVVRRNLNYSAQKDLEVQNFQQDLWDDIQPLPLDIYNSTDQGNGNGCRCIWKSECPTCTPPQLKGPPASIQVKQQIPVILNYEYCVQLEEEIFFQLCGLTPSQFTFFLNFLGREVANHLKYRYDRGTPKKAMEESQQRRLSLEDRLLMTLMRLRKGWDVRDLGLFYGVGVAAASTIISTWIRFMYFQTKRVEKAMFVSRHLQPTTNRPKVFKPFPNFRVCIDTTEVRIEVPTDFEQQGNSYSDYKSGNVILYLIGISCWGGVSFVSPGFEGSMSDQEIYRRSGIRNFLDKGDLILADRGFAVQEECDEDEVVLLHPPFLSGREKFTPEEEQLTKEIAHARIFVEHIIRKIKVWDVLKNMHNTTLARLDQIMSILGFLVNLQPPHIVDE